MSRFLYMQSYPTGPRCWIIGQRCHHGATGLLAVGVGAWIHDPLVIAAGLMLMWHDRRDARVWLRREGRPT